MRRRSRARRILKWVGLVGCVGTILLFASSWIGAVGIVWRADADLWHVQTIPGNLHCGVWNDVKDNWQFRDAESGVHIDTAPPALKDPGLLFLWPRAKRTHALPAKGTGVLLPLWTSFLMLAVPTAWLWYRDRRPPRGHCQHCGYNLTGNESGTCPECGEAVA